jgi:hypothetical protein
MPDAVHVAKMTPEEDVAWLMQTDKIVVAEDLEVLQQVFKSGKSERINIESHKPWMEDEMLKVYETPGAKA